MALALGVIFTLGFAAIVFADDHIAMIPEGTHAVVAAGTPITLNGIMFFGGKYIHGADLNSSTEIEKANDSEASYIAMVGVFLLADISKNTQGHLSFITDKVYWTVGEASPFMSEPWSEPGAIGAMGNTKKGPILLNQAWLQHTSDMLGFPAGIKIGHQDFSLGNKVFFSHSAPGDDGIKLFFDPTKQLHAELWTIKLSEGTDSADDDTDFYAASLAYKGKGFNLSGDYGRWVSATHGVNTNGAIVSNLAAGDHGTNVNNFGLRGDATFGDLNVTAEANLQSGKTAYENSSIKHKGRNYVLSAGYKLSPATLINDIISVFFYDVLGISYKLSPITALSLAYGYGSGDDNSADDENHVFINSTSPGIGVSGATYVYQGVVPSATGIKSTHLLANTVYIKAGLAQSLTKDLKTTLNYFILRAAELNSSAAINGLTTHLSRKIGTELDAQITYTINKNMDYVVETGYLWTGKFYDSATIAAGDAYSLMHRISLRF